MGVWWPFSLSLNTFHRHEGPYRLCKNKLCTGIIIFLHINRIEYNLHVTFCFNKEIIIDPPPPPPPQMSGVPILLQMEGSTPTHEKCVITLWWISQILLRNNWGHSPPPPPLQAQLISHLFEVSLLHPPTPTLKSPQKGLLYKVISLASLNKNIGIKLL